MKTTNSNLVRKWKKTALSAAMAAALGVSTSATATEYDFTFTGAFTMLDNGGGFMQNTSIPTYDAVTNPYSGYRTLITGTIRYNTVTGAGSATLVPFDFFNGSLPAEAVGVTLQAIGDGAGGAGTLLLGNMLFNWNGNYGIPVSIVLDAQGMLSALGASPSIGATLDRNLGVVGASELVQVPATKFTVAYSLPMGKQTIATTSWNTTLNGAAVLNNSAIGKLPLIADAIGGSPMLTVPFSGSNANFDFKTLTVTAIDGISGPPTIFSTVPATNATDVLVGSKVTIAFDHAVDPAAVAANFTLAGPGAVNIPGTMSPSSGAFASTFEFTPTSILANNTIYTATLVNTGIVDAIGAGQQLAAGRVWSFTTKAAPVIVGTTATCNTLAAAGSFKGTFTMLDGSGGRVGRDTAVTGTWSGTTNTTSTGTDFNMTLQSPNPFYGAIWVAHDIRVFGPGTYSINTGCSVAEFQGGVAPASCAVQGQYMNFTVDSGELGAHILFDWNGNNNISVVNVWKQNPQGTCTGSEVPLRSTDGSIVGYGLATTDLEGDGIAGLPMATTSPFPLFNANFDLFGDATAPVANVPLTDAGTTGGGCAVNPNAAFDPSLPGVLLVGLGYFGWKRRRSDSC